MKLAVILIPCFNFQILLDRGFRNDMQKLYIECNLCLWQGELKQYQVSYEEQYIVMSNEENLKYI